jgi:hypothetical protein
MPRLVLDVQRPLGRGANHDLSKTSWLSAIALAMSAKPGILAPGDPMMKKVRVLLAGLPLMFLAAGSPDHVVLGPMIRRAALSFSGPPTR